MGRNAADEHGGLQSVDISCMMTSRRSVDRSISILKTGSVQAMKLPARCPYLTAFADRGASGNERENQQAIFIESAAISQPSGRQVDERVASGEQRRTLGRSRISERFSPRKR